MDCTLRNINVLVLLKNGIISTIHLSPIFARQLLTFFIIFIYCVFHIIITSLLWVLSNYFIHMCGEAIAMVKVRLIMIMTYFRISAMVTEMVLFVAIIITLTLIIMVSLSASLMFKMEISIFLRMTVVLMVVAITLAQFFSLLFIIWTIGRYAMTQMMVLI